MTKDNTKAGRSENNAGQKSNPNHKSSKKHEENIGITVKKAEDIAEWYQQVCLRGELAEYAPVKGCMIIKPNGYAIWEGIQDYFNKIIKLHKVKNVYFPLFIPESFFKKEAQHAQGFSPEVAWIANKEDEYDKERLAIRPTSETIMYDAFSRWIRSWRDLPVKINQWCNVVRWETEATKLFLRSREFLWQEGHCAYETKEEAEEETLTYLQEYKRVCEELLAFPVIAGRKTDKEKFAGAVYTTTVEALMPDGKALQCGTSHLLSQGFAKSFGISFLGRNEQQQMPWQISWGISTRLIGATVLMHSDDSGLILPPRVAPVKAMIVPIIFEESKKAVVERCYDVADVLKNVGIPVEVDAREEYSSGWKYNQYEMLGVPLRIEIGPKDLEKDQVVLVRRDTRKKDFVKVKDLQESVEKTLEQMHHDLFSKAIKFLDENVVKVNSFTELIITIKDKKLAKALWCGATECEEKIKDKTAGVNARVLPFEDNTSKPHGECVLCGKDAMHVVVFGRSY
ncbi:TPA: proline--tRNA ligase [Candidatus Woesearchaeota archaeon]|nr:proline--tRNA ligase [Candidatus Woesearchaeota archaeon]